MKILVSILLFLTLAAGLAWRLRCIWRACRVAPEDRQADGTEEPVRPR